MKPHHQLFLITIICFFSIALFYIAINQVDSQFNIPTVENEGIPTIQLHPEEYLRSQSFTKPKKDHSRHHKNITVCDIGFFIFHSEGNHDRLMNLRRSWLQDLCGPSSLSMDHRYHADQTNYLFLSSNDNSNDSMVDSQCGEEDSNVCCKTNFLILNGLQLMPKKKWYFKLDDDTFVRPEALLNYLLTLDESKPLLVGGEAFSVVDFEEAKSNPLNIKKLAFPKKSPWGLEDGYSLSQNFIFPRGGSGYVLTPSIIQSLQDSGNSFYSKICQSLEEEDLAMASAVLAANGFIHTHIGFNAKAPAQSFIVDTPYITTAPITWHILQELYETHNTDIMPSLRHITRPTSDFNPSYTGYVESESVSLLYPNPCIDMIGKQQVLLLETYSRVLSGYNRVAVIGFPDHPNRGDSAIWIGEIILLQKLGIEIVYVATLPRDYNGTLMRSRLEEASSTSCILFHGGGNFGDIYPIHEKLREMVTVDFPDFPIFSFPQTVWFKNEDNIDKAKDIYESHPRVQLAGRDRASYEFLLQHFHVTKGVIALPDSAFMIGNQIDRRLAHPPKYDILFISRTDAEVVKGITQEFYNLLNGTEEGKGLTFLADDWIKGDVRGIDKKLTPNTQKAWMRTVDGMHFLSRAKVVITNRLHGHILMTLLGIPHILLDNNYGKLGTYSAAWTSECFIGRKEKSIESGIIAAKELLANLTIWESLSPKS